MHRLWVANAEEALPEDDPFYEHNVATKTMRIFPRFMLCLKPGDCLVLPTRVPDDFADYIIRLLKLSPREECLYQFSHLSKPYTMADSILEDPKALEELRKKTATGGWKIEPFIETPRIVRLARETGLRTELTQPELVWHGMINVLNDKSCFKKLSSTLNIPTVPGLEANSLAELKKAIKFSAERYTDIMLRKVKYAGGAGNRHGSAEELMAVVSDWYSGGKVLVEPFLDLSTVAGSLAYLDRDMAKFIGMDLQVFRNGGWTGFEYPYPESEGGHRVQEYTERLAEAMQLSGARGYLNIDWAFTKDEPQSPMALECNFRSNGFGYVTEFAEKYFGDSWRDMTISCREAIDTEEKSTGALIYRFKDRKINGRPLLISEPGATEGAVITAPPFDGGFSAAVFSRDPEFTRRGLEILQGKA